MPERAHIEEYFVTDQIKDRRWAVGFRIGERRYWRVVEENIYTSHRKELITELSNLYVARMYAQAWNQCLDAQKQEEKAS